MRKGIWDRKINRVKLTILFLLEIECSNELGKQESVVSEEARNLENDLYQREESTEFGKHGQNILCFSWVLDHVGGEEKEGAEKYLLDYFLERTVSYGHVVSCCVSNVLLPSWVDLEIKVIELIRLWNIKSLIRSLYSVVPQKVIIVHITVVSKSKLWMKHI